MAVTIERNRNVIFNAGEPSVKNIPTYILFDEYKGGRSLLSIADDFGLTLNDVVGAIHYETEIAKGKSLPLPYVVDLPKR